MGLNAKQVEQLLRPVNPRRVQKDRDGMSHLAGYDVSAHLTRIFGFGGWEKRIRSLELVSEAELKDTKRDRMGWHVTYRCLMTLDVKDPAGNVIWSNDDGATGSASNLPTRGDAHDFAMKNAITYALKRCAKDLGDQFGLSLYNKGSLDPLIIRTLAADGESTADVEQDIPELHPDADDAAPSDAPADTPVPSAAKPARPAASATAGNGSVATAGKISRPASPSKVTAPEGAVTDIDWMAHLVDDLIPAASTRRELAGFWSNVAEHVRDGKCIDEHAKQILAMVNERAAELGFERSAA